MIYDYLRKNPYSRGRWSIVPMDTHNMPPPHLSSCNQEQLQKKTQKDKKIQKLSTTGGVYSSPTDQGNVTTIKLWTSSCKVVWNQHYDLGATQDSKVNVESEVLPSFS